MFESINLIEYYLVVSSTVDRKRECSTFCSSNSEVRVLTTGKADVWRVLCSCIFPNICGTKQRK